MPSLADELMGRVKPPKRTPTRCTKKEQAIALYAQGYSQRFIAKELDVGKTTVCFWVNERKT